MSNFLNNFPHFITESIHFTRICQFVTKYNRCVLKVSHKAKFI